MTPVASVADSLVEQNAGHNMSKGVNDREPTPVTYHDKKKHNIKSILVVVLSFAVCAMA